MQRPVVTLDYYAVAFEREPEAAAFVAALSRFLSYPQGEVYVSGAAPLEVWSRKAGGGATVYLTGSALGAANADFAPVPVAAVVRGEALPEDCKLILGRGLLPIWGLTSAQDYL